MLKTTKGTVVKQNFDYSLQNYHLDVVKYSKLTKDYSTVINNVLQQVQVTLKQNWAIFKS